MDASVLLRQALEGTRSHSDVVEEPSVEVMSKSGTVTADLQFSQTVGVPFSLSPAKEAPPADGSLYLHTQGVSFSTRSLQAIASDPLVCLSLASAVILYNLAVVNQLQGLQGSFCKQTQGQQVQETQDRHTQRAISFFGTCRMLLQEAGINPHQAIGIPLLDFLSMAIYNNIGYAAFEQGDYQAAERYFRQLEVFTSSLRTITPFQQWDGETYMLMDRFMNEFLLNTLVLGKPSLAAAA